MRWINLPFLICIVFAQDRGIVPDQISMKKVALVIGNSSYLQAPLKNPVNDLRAVKQSLAQLGFQVFEGQNLDRRGMERTIDTFAARLSPGDLALFYFSGHGLQVAQENYLLPVDFAAQTEADVKYAAYPASQIRDRMEASGSRLRLLILDACRDNPFRGTRSGTRGLAAMVGVEGTLIAFAASDNQVASDNAAEGNGLFTKHLLQAFETPGLGLVEVFRQAKREVYAASKGHQNPAIYDNVIGEYILNNPDVLLQRNAAEIARLEAELAELNRKRDAALVQQSETEKRRTALVEATLTSERLQRQKLIEEAKRKADLGAELQRREQARKAEEQRVAELRTKVDRERRDLSRLAESSITLEQARQRAKELRGRILAVEAEYEKQEMVTLAELWKDYAPLRAEVEKSLVKDKFETTPQFEARRVKAQEDLAAVNARYATERERIRKRYAEEARQATASERAEENTVLGKTYLVTGMHLTGFDYDADNRAFTLAAGALRYRGPMDVEVARRIDAEMPNLTVRQKIDGTSVYVVDRATLREYEAKAMSLINPKDGLLYKWIPRGAFQMGCSDDDKTCSADEKPVRVEISKEYWMAEIEVTQKAFERVTGRNPSWFRSSDNPVENVSWYEAVEYCRAVGGRLPTEAEWEWAARAGTNGPRHGEVDGIAWYKANADAKTHAVRQKRPNEYGLYDMLGNVWEWVSDWYSDKLQGGRDPHRSANGQRKVLRGGSWDYDSRYSRASYREATVPDDRRSTIGFRCAKD